MSQKELTEVKTRLLGQRGAPGGGEALWYTKDGSDDIFYRRREGPSKLEQACIASPHKSEKCRYYEPIIRRDEEKSLYDVTRVFFEEYMFFPFGARKDFVDAMSRIYDMEPASAVAFERFVPKDYPDS